MTKSVIVIGGGPAGLMAADIISQRGIKVNLYDAMPSVGRKFLMAGKSGLNLTHSESYSTFVTRYGKAQTMMSHYLERLTPKDLIAFVNDLGVETFVGSSGRVFPKEMKASPLLRAWLNRLKEQGVIFHLRHRWVGWENEQLVFETPQGRLNAEADKTILALGGASWPKLGSIGTWTSLLENKGIRVNSFKPSNCGFIVNWSQHFSDKYHGEPIKSVVLSFGRFKQPGEFVITQKGIEGSLIYAASASIREAIEEKNTASIQLDLAPDVSREKLILALSRSRGSRTLTTHIKKTTGLSNVKIGLLYEYMTKEDLNLPEKIADHIKCLSIPLIATTSLLTAISSAGGVALEELDADLMLKKLPNVFCVGEMLDWEAPTGGYLLTACFATGKAAAEGVIKGW